MGREDYVCPSCTEEVPESDTVEVELVHHNLANRDVSYNKAKVVCQTCASKMRLPDVIQKCGRKPRTGGD